MNIIKDNISLTLENFITFAHQNSQFMRINLKTTPSQEGISFNYQPKLVGVLHKWLGPNEIHGRLSMHSFSWLMGGNTTHNGIVFDKGAKFFISFHDPDKIRQIVRTILEDPVMFGGMVVTDVSIQEDPDLSNCEFFRIGSPVFIQRRLENGKNRHYTYEDEEAGRLLEETLKHKMRVAGLPEDETLEISFAKEYPKRKIKTIFYNEIGNRTSWCPLRIKGKPETKVFAWNVGAGSGTGVGFGSIY